MYKNNIVAIEKSNCIYLDDKFYKMTMKEGDKTDMHMKSFPVKVVAMRISWILTKPEGKELLETIYEQSELEIYQNEGLIMLIEYLYS